MERLDPKTSLLVVVDVQERLQMAMPRPAVDRLVANAVLLLEAARLLGVAVVATEQYPKGLGRTVEPIAEKLRAMGVQPFEKLTFDVCGDPAVARAIADRAQCAAIAVGLEAHICVFQSVRELARRGIDVRVAADAVASRTEDNRALGLGLCERAGAVVMPTEAIVFDWLGTAGTSEFRALSKLMR
jgi:nicotinamidase-related amidase